MKEFVHLHLHTEHSLLDGMCRIEQVTQMAHKEGMRALAITDHGTMGGVLKFYEEALKHGVRPIIGAEMYIAPGSRFQQEYTSRKEASFHITLLAANEKGYRNLLKLSTLSFTEGYYYTQRIDKEILSENSEGIIVLSGCLKGEITSYLINGDIDKAVEMVGVYQDIVGRENFYLEVMENKIPEQDKANKLLVEIARKTGAGLVATNDCHYLKKGDAFAHEVLLCIQTQTHIEDKDRMRFQTDEFYFKTSDEMYAAFKDIPESLKNTLVISERCNVKIDVGRYHLPVFHPPEGKNPDIYLEELIIKGLKEKFGIECRKKLKDYTFKNEIVERAAYEFEVIKKMGFSSYFLIIQDFVNYARTNNIRVGPGRGSAAGSLVAYLLGITEINPLTYNLIFERFLNPERISLPDVDVDFCDRRRDEVIAYIREKYGKENVSQIGTYGRMAARAVVRDVGRALGLTYTEVDRVAKLISPEPGATLSEEIVHNADIKKIMESEERIKNLFDIALKLEGLARHSSTHAAGLVITETPVYEYAPLFRASSGELATQYEMEAIEKIGLLKVDILGLKTLAVIEDTLKLIKERKGIDIKEFPLDDKNTYQLLSRGESLGVFQLESKGMQKLLKDIEPQNFEDLIAILALYRPGPMKSGMVEEYIRRKKTPSCITYDHPSLEPILKSTYGVILYQEQVMEIAHQLAGFTMGQADELRRSMGKKDIEAMEEKRGLFIEGAKKNGVSEPLARKIFEQIAKFAGYGFNKSHSTGYALISYQTAFLKANYPLEFMTALLNSEIGNFDKIAGYIDECERMNIWLLPPDISESDERFKIFSNDILFGLSAVKNVGEGAIKSIIEARERGLFTSIFDFCERVNLRSVNKKVIESLVKAGAFDYLEIPRSQLFAMIDEAIERGSKMQKKKSEGEMNIFTAGKNSITFNVNRNIVNSLPEWSETRLLSYEKEMLGVYLTGHPLTRYTSIIKMFSNVSISELEDVKENMPVCIGGILTEIKRTSNRKGERMGWGEMEDTTGRVKVLFYPRVYESYSALIRKGGMIFVKGRVEKREGITVIADDVANLNTAKDRFISSVEVDINLPFPDEKLEKLKGLFIKNKGNCQLYINLIKDGKKKVKIRAMTYAINPDIDFLEELKIIVGESSFHIMV
ncbi:MAG: DNA polymerase III subunit alpha [Candidatus Omnitrophica bacterium]|nr:DNA polymerase III subunit alpha [Candidatus Omnitrophota bacterium]